jgi:hypothetical protein
MVVAIVYRELFVSCTAKELTKSTAKMTQESIAIAPCPVPTFRKP